jgi:hypothetical protein
MKAEHRRKIVVDNSNIVALQAQWACQRKALCPWGNAHCYVVDNVHLKLHSQHLKSWSMAINAGDATMDEPPAELARLLNPSVASGVNPLRSSRTAVNATPVTPSTTAPPGYPHPPPYPYYPYPPPTQHPYPHLHPHPLSTQSPYTPPPQSYEAIRSINLRSSPVSDSDPVESLNEYIVWLCRGSPLQAAELSQCRDALKLKGHTIETILHITKEEFEAMNILPGIATQLKMKMKKFKKQRMQLRV